MKETGIIMSGDHPKLILEGKKTITRRVIESKLLMLPHTLEVYKEADHYEARWISKAGVNHYCNDLLAHCPYGGVGDRLWVKETFWHPPIYVGDVFAGLIKKDTSIVSYKANLEPHQAERQIWKPSIFMPRWASRITLEITEVRVERLQEISHDDVGAEGLSNAINNPLFFPTVWDSLNAKRGFGWETNPFVWCISFKRVDN